MIPTLPGPYVDHLVSPRRVGDVRQAQAAGEVGSMVGGLGVRVTLTWKAAGRGRAVIADAAARTFGSATSVAPASILMERVVGLTADNALRVTAEAVAAALGNGSGEPALPPLVLRGAEFAVRALHRALGVPGPGGPSDPTGPGILVCRCLGVGDRQVRRAIQDGARDPEQVGERCRASTGCRSCRPDILMILDEETGDAPSLPPADLHPVARIALARVGPVLRAMGRPLEGATVDGDVVRLRLGPGSHATAISTLGAVAVARHVLRETVWDRIRVELTDDDERNTGR